MLRSIGKLIFFLLFFSVGYIKAQDLQYSQYYNAPLFLNPAFAGTADNSRIITNYRTQWTGLSKPYNTFSFSADHLAEPLNAGFGVIARKDAQGTGRLNSTEVGVIGSYILNLSDNWAIIPAIQASFISRSLNYDNLKFGDQIDVNNPGVTNPTIDQLAKNDRRSFMDFTTGGVLFSDVMWFGLSLNHLNQPNQAFGGVSDRLPLKSTINFGYKFYFDDPNYKNYKEKSLIPTFLYKTQGKFDQLDVGLYGIWDPIMLGLWYRGIPVKKYSRNYNNNDAIVVMAGLHFGGLSFAYSYDITVSTLAPYSGGAHELTLSFEFVKPYKLKKKRRSVPCPKFYGNRLRT